MINFEISGTLPKVSDIGLIMARIADRLKISADEQFNTSGHGSWLPTREGTASHLRGVQETLQKASGDNWAEISFKNTIHQRGGSMILTERQRRFFWSQYYDTNDEKYKWMALSVRGIMRFPVRAITVMKEDFDFIYKEFGDRLFTIEEISKTKN
jgi:phage gpG-like protein